MQQLEIDFSSTVAPMVGTRQIVVTEKQSPATADVHPVGELWQRVVRKKQTLAAMRLQLDGLLQWLDREISDDRAAVAEAMTELTERLLQHMSRKSLAQWQRLEVAIWVLDNIESLDGFGRDTDTFKKSYQSLFEQFYEAPADAQIDDDSDWLSQVFTDLQGQSVDAADSSDEPAEPQIADRGLPPGADAAADDDPAPAHADQISDAFLTRLFRRTAKVLHPDLAAHEAERQRNEGLMKTLLKARREQDVATLFDLYFEHAGAPDLDAGVADLECMTALLQRQLQQLQHESDALADQSPLHRWVVDNLLDNNERQQRRALGRMRAELYEMGRQARAICWRVRTLASLKPVLAERHDARLFS